MFTLGVVKLSTVKKTAIGIVIGVALTTLFFMGKDFFTVRTKIPKGHVTVRLLIEASNPIDSIVLISNYSRQTIILQNQPETVITFPNAGEGTFKICSFFKSGEKVCTNELYVESGYLPVLKVKDDEIEGVEWN